MPVQNKPFPSTAEYRQLSLEKRAKLLPPPSDDRMEELKIGRKKASRVRVEFYPEVPEMSRKVEKRSIRTDNRNHPSEEQLKAQGEQQIITPVRRRGRGR